MNRSFLAPLLLLATLSACNAAPVPPPQTVAGADFLARNRTARNVVTTSSGLQYFIVKPGPRSGAHPAAGDGVNFDYEGKLLTGETFDSSFERHESLSGAVGNFVPGFNEALMLMRPGDEWIVWIPPELGYGAQESGPIPANSVLRFRMVLNSVTRLATPAG